MKIKNKIALILFSITIITSCGKEYKEEIKVNSTGKAGEVMIVIDNYRWESQIGDSLFEAFTAPFEVLPQEESSYRVSHTSSNNFTNILTKHRNILIVKIENNLKDEIIITHDKWANNQLVIQINSSNDSSFIKYWTDNKKNIVKTYFNEDIKRLQTSFTKYLNNKAIEKIKEKYNLQLSIPADFNLDVIKEDFCWISKETPKSSQSILIYIYPFTDSLQLLPDNIIKKRDLVAKQNVPGPKDGTYMQTEKRIELNQEKIIVNNKNAILLRGLWYIENYFMGGPFISITIPDYSQKRIVTIDAFVYGGKEDKKILIWQVEAIIKTIKFEDK